MPDAAALYYTCLTHPETIERACRAQLLRGVEAHNLELVTVSRGAPIDFGHNVVVAGERGPLTMHRQILAGLERVQAAVTFLCESDVLYHPSHFAHAPRFPDTFEYNTNVWRVRWPDGHAVWTDDLQQVSGICAPTALLLDFYRARVAQIERDGFNRHYEPGPKQTVGSRLTANWQSSCPNLCLRHGHNLTASKWSPSAYRNPQYAAGWRETDTIPGWGKLGEFLPMKELA